VYSAERTFSTRVYSTMVVLRVLEYSSTIIGILFLLVASRIKTTGVVLPRLDGAKRAGFGRWRAWGEVRPGRSRQTAAFCGRSSCPAAAGASVRTDRRRGGCNPRGNKALFASASPFVLGLPRAPAFTHRPWINEPPATTPAVGFRVRAGPGWLPWCRSSAQVFTRGCSRPSRQL
jgi:hypothetical protein